jgi:hypothetical protein
VGLSYQRFERIHVKEGMERGFTLNILADEFDKIDFSDSDKF